MRKLVTEKSGRCVGGDFVLTVKLFENQNKYEIIVHTGFTSTAKKFMHLILTQSTLTEARQKYKKVVDSFTILWALDDDLEK